MTYIKVEVNLAESTKTISDMIKKHILEGVGARFISIAGELLPVIQLLITNAIKAQPEYESLDGGQLAADFGFKDGRARIDAIIDIWASSVKVVSKPSANFNSGKIGTIFITAIPTDYEIVLAEPEAVVTTLKGTSLEWLRWLLTNGSGTIIRNYDVKYTPGARASRSGKAIMVSSPTGWGVPDKYSGTPGDNFLTRALDSIQDEFNETITIIVNKKLGT